MLTRLVLLEWLSGASDPTTTFAGSGSAIGHWALFDGASPIYSTFGGTVRPGGFYGLNDGFSEYSALTVFNGVSMAGSVTTHSGVSRPSILNRNVATKQYKQHDFKPDGVNRETYLDNGEIL